MALTDVLNGLLNGLTAQLTSSPNPQPGQLVTATLAGLPANLQLTDVLQGDLNLVVVSKNVLYGNSDPESDLSLAALTAATTGAEPVTGSTAIIPGINGVTGLLGQLKGSIPLPGGGQFPLQVTVSWAVQDASGNALDGSQFTSPSGLSAPDVSVAFVPPVEELTGGAPSLVQRRLVATVTLAANAVSVGPRTLPPLTVSVPAIPVPTVAVFFLHTNFAPKDGDDDGATLIVVPADSPLRSLAQLQPVLDTLSSTANTLQSLGSFASFLLGLSDLTQALAGANVSNIQFRAADRIDNLNDITLISRPWYENDTEAEDELSSMILVGVPQTGIHCFNDRHYKTGEGEFTLTTGEELIAMIRDFDGKNPTAQMGSIVVDHTPPGGLWDPDKFNDELSSIEFVPAPG